eukprot:355986-Chlamydomonas_euryale.AAC.19
MFIPLGRTVPKCSSPSDARSQNGVAGHPSTTLLAPLAVVKIGDWLMQQRPGDVHTSTVCPLWEWQPLQSPFAPALAPGHRILHLLPPYLPNRTLETHRSCVEFLIVLLPARGPCCSSAAHRNRDGRSESGLTATLHCSQSTVSAIKRPHSGLRTRKTCKDCSQGALRASGFGGERTCGFCGDRTCGFGVDRTCRGIPVLVLSCVPIHTPGFLPPHQCS